MFITKYKYIWSTHTHIPIPGPHLYPSKKNPPKRRNPLLNKHCFLMTINTPCLYMLHYLSEYMYVSSSYFRHSTTLSLSPTFLYIQNPLVTSVMMLIQFSLRFLRSSCIQQCCCKSFEEKVSSGALGSDLWVQRKIRGRFWLNDWQMLCQAHWHIPTSAEAYSLLYICVHALGFCLIFFF
jgi:hypothetical protein